MAATRKTAEPSQPRRPAARTPEAREMQLVSKAYDLAERQIDEGSASAQVITHFLKMGTANAELEREKLRGEIELQQARIKGMASAERVEELYEKAITAMQIYAGHDVQNDQDELNEFI